MFEQVDDSVIRNDAELRELLSVISDIAAKKVHASNTSTSVQLTDKEKEYGYRSLICHIHFRIYGTVNVTVTSLLFGTAPDAVSNHTTIGSVFVGIQCVLLGTVV
jgi:hypothetical protein